MHDDFCRRVEAIEERNTKVEMDKAWETSSTRLAIISCVTYVTAALFLHLTDLPHPLLNAFVPTLGYVFSMQSLPSIKKIWIRRFVKKEDR